MDIQDVEKHDNFEEFRLQFTPELFEQVSEMVTRQVCCCFCR